MEKSKRFTKARKMMLNIGIVLLMAALAVVLLGRRPLPAPDPCSVCAQVLPTEASFYVDQWDVPEMGHIQVMVERRGNGVAIQVQSGTSFPEITKYELNEKGGLRRWVNFGLAEGNEILDHTFDPDLDDSTPFVEKDLPNLTVDFYEYPRLTRPFLWHQGPVRAFIHSAGPQGLSMWKERAEDVVRLISRHLHPTTRY